MTLLHDYFNLRDQQAFQRLLDGSTDCGPSIGLSSSGGKSWNRSSTLKSTMASDVNARDWLGRTVLHLACTSPECIEYVRLLLRHPGINVNLPDTESHWTPLHRALYQANFPAAILLLQRPDTDRTLQDFEGYTAFDLYNSTINGTNPKPDEVNAELYTWGINRNAALGLGDGNDRTYPDQVIIQKKDRAAEDGDLSARFSPTYIRQIHMSKLHTVIITSESTGNLRACGFGSGGRLGPGQHTQYNFKAFSHFPYTIISVALGQDHTLALTKTGEVISWGLNRFAQLGYVVENTVAGEGFGRIEEPIQATPRKVQGPLKKETVRGVAASKGASACWTTGGVYTWGTNNGQLGYDKTAQPVQILPRMATKVTQPVLAISLTDFAMACLLESQDVICIWNDRQVKILFPGHAFPSEMQPYRPPQAIRDAKIAKITSCDDTFAALSFNGELFIFSVSGPPDIDNSQSGKERTSFKPQRVWALRKKFSAVKDVALGSDGSIIVCTESGHVFVRSRNTKGGQTMSSKTFKFQRVPHLQRVTQVCANSTGAFGALRVEYRPEPIGVSGNTIAQDLAEIQPYLLMCNEPQGRPSPLKPSLLPTEFGLDDGTEDVGIGNDIQRLLHLFDAIDAKKSYQEYADPAIPNVSRLPHGADVMIKGPSGILFPAHRVILGARSSVLCSVLDGVQNIRDKRSGISIQLLDNDIVHKPLRLKFNGCHPITLLIFLVFIYSDELLALWDGRISAALSGPVQKHKINPSQVRLELCSFANLLNLPLLSQALESPVKCMPAPSMAVTLARLFHTAKSSNPTVTRRLSLAPDVILQLADKDVQCHSVVLRARSAFFADFFGEEIWTVNRWGANSMIIIDMKHLNWHVMKFVLDFMCSGADAEIFDTLDFTKSVDDVLEFMFDVMAAANELLLDRLVLLCSTVILKYTSLNNACFILSDATYLHAEQLIDRLQNFIAVNMELFLTTGMLDDISTYLVKQLTVFAQQKQMEKSPVSRLNKLALEAMVIHADWLSLQDIPHLIPRSSTVISRKDSANFKLSSSVSGKKSGWSSTADSHQGSSSIRPQRLTSRPHSIDDIFTMDDADMPDHVKPSIRVENTSTHTPPVWKASLIPRVDMKAVMAETANASALQKPRDMTPKVAVHKGSPSPIQADLHNPPHLVESTSIGTTLSRTATPNWRVARNVSLTHTLRTDATSSNSPPRLSNAKRLQFPGLGESLNPNSPQTPPRDSGTPRNLGPVITPTRQPSLSHTATIRRASGSAWNQQSTKPPTAPSSETPGMSFVAIQQLQLNQVKEPKKDKRSLREIQEEEKALQEEANFLIWWTAEEERMKREAEAGLDTALHSSGSKPPKKQTVKVVRSSGKSVHYSKRKPGKPNQQGKGSP